MCRDSWPNSGSGGPLTFSSFFPDMPRSDGYLAGKLNIQGARAYDSNLSQWITPDPYKGSDDDPTSQWAYQWNANNPIKNSDASGYDTCNGGSAHTDDSACSNPPANAQCGTADCLKQIIDLKNGCRLDCQFARLAGVWVYWTIKGGQPYVGITNDIERRSFEHGSELKQIFELSTRLRARGVEQWFMNSVKGKLTSLRNVINSISIKNPAIDDAIEEGVKEVEESKPGSLSEALNEINSFLECCLK
jgi:RHS repeat-associated protein